MAWNKIADMLYEDCEEERVKGVETDGSIDTRHGRHIDKFCRLH